MVWSCGKNVCNFSREKGIYIYESDYDGHRGGERPERGWYDMVSDCVRKLEWMK